MDERGRLRREERQVGLEGEISGVPESLDRWQMHKLALLQLPGACT